MLNMLNITVQGCGIDIFEATSKITSITEKLQSSEDESCNNNLKTRRRCRLACLHASGKNQSRTRTIVSSKQQVLTCTLCFLALKRTFPASGNRIKIKAANCKSFWGTATPRTRAFESYFQNFRTILSTSVFQPRETS